MVAADVRRRVLARTSASLRRKLRGRRHFLNSSWSRIDAGRVDIGRATMHFIVRWDHKPNNGAPNSRSARFSHGGQTTPRRTGVRRSGSLERFLRPRT